MFIKKSDFIHVCPEYRVKKILTLVIFILSLVLSQILCVNCPTKIYGFMSVLLTSIWEMNGLFFNDYVIFYEYFGLKVILYDVSNSFFVRILYFEALFT